MNTSTCIIDEYGDKYWRLNGKLHRIDGPAVERADGGTEWWLYGEQINLLVHLYATYINCNQ